RSAPHNQEEKMKIRPSARAGKRAAVVGAALALIGTAVATGGPSSTSASSHREAPLIAGDPRADNTDVYAFVSPDDPDTVTLISNWIPFEEPNGGPNFYPFADDTLYNIKIDNDGDALEDLEYTWVFTTTFDPSTFLYNNGPVTSLDDPNLLYYQTYDLTEIRYTDGVEVSRVTLLDDQRAAPSLVGPASIPDYAPLVDEATVDILGGAGQTYAGQADDPFFLDLRVFDLLYGGDLSERGVDTLAGFNVNTLAIQVPKTVLAAAGDATNNPVIGIWSTTDRRSVLNADGTGSGAVEYTQVSRLGNPLVNEVVLPLALKDAFNSIEPDADATAAGGAAVAAVQFPLVPPLVNALYGVPVPGDNNGDGDNTDAGDDPRHDLVEIFLQGISEANAGLSGDPAVVLPVDLNGHDLNAVAATTTLQPSEQLRLNMSIAPSADPNRLGVFAGQFDGFPNGRRLVDDVLDIELQVLEGADPTTSPVTIIDALATGDLVDRNDKEFRDTFPYLALPHSDSVNGGFADRTPRAAEFVSVAPVRVLDTRDDGGQVGFTGDKPADGAVVRVNVTGNASVPDDAKAVAVNITLAENVGPTFVTAYNCDDARPTASNVNAREISGGTSNLALIGISGSGEICLYTLRSSHLIADIGGYLPSTSTITTVTPERLLETREEFGQVGYTGTQPKAGQTITLNVTGNAGVPADAKAVFVNVTSVDSIAPGFVTVWDCEGTRPTTSALNYEPGVVIPNFVAAPIGADGAICLYTSAGTDLLVDLMGVVPAGSTYVPATPGRIVDTRESFGPIGGGQVIEVQVTGTGDAMVPVGTTSVLLNVTTTNESDLGFVTVFPCGSERPNASTGNFRGAGMSTANLVSANVGPDGKVCIFVLNQVDIIVDLVGSFPSVTG
ncbi:MAG: DUF4331 domain-containing protein, partial [Ilumatobacter sp.]